MDKYAELTFDGQITGRVISRETAKTEGRSYGITYVVLFSEGDVLLQERSHKKESQPGCFDLSAGGHVEPHDANGTDDVDIVFRRAGVREAREELSVDLDPVSLQLLMCFHEDKKAPTGIPYRKHHRVYTHEFDRRGCCLEYNRSEIASLKWVTIQQLIDLPQARITKELRRCRRKLQAHKKGQ